MHHTVNANDYTRSEVPGLLRGIYAYHVKSRGWSDIGYNYLVDRFGRIWEGRYGGVDRPVVGAHTLGFNDDSFAASAIGNYQIAHPSQAMIEAYGTLYAWKLSLHGVDAGSTRQYVTSRWFQAINGHRDAAATLCPGQYLYAKLPEIRQARRRCAARVVRPAARVQPGLHAPPGPRRTASLRRRGVRDPHRRDDPVPRPVTAATGASGSTRCRDHARPHRGPPP